MRARKLTILLALPPGAESLSGNRVSAERWAAILTDLGHTVAIAESLPEDPPGPDLLIALHAKKSAPLVARFHALYPERPRIVALTGTDLYGDIRSDAAARQTLALATHLVVLQPAAVAELPAALRSKTRVIVQSARCPAARPQPEREVFEVIVSGHLREVKDPFRAAAASRLLPAESKIVIRHLGAALSPQMAEQARREMAQSPRYRWLGALPREEALARLAAARLLVVSSFLEGGANVVCEAIACGVPVLTSRIAGSLGLLGDDYPGVFPVGDTAALAALLWRAETEPAFYAALRERVRDLRPLVAPEREREAWRALLAELG